MKIVNCKETETSKNPHGVEIKKLHGNEHVHVAHALLKPGEIIKSHTTPVDVFFYILEGEGIVEIGDEKQKVSRDMLIDSPKGIPHSLYNEGTEIFRFLIVKTPNPTL
jgi:mannose-6-phosphate isomerase-like protein (cupin superfamily)